MQRRLVAVALLSVFSAACGHFSVEGPDTRGPVNKMAKEKLAVAKERQDATRETVVEHHNVPFLDFKTTALRASRGDLSVAANDTPIGAILAELTRKAGYSLSFADSIDVKKRVSVNFHNATPETALKDTAFLAGYVAVVDKVEKSVIITESATITYRVPTSLFQNFQATVNAGGNPTNSTSGGSASGEGSSSSGSSGGSGLKAEFTIAGKMGQNGAVFAQLIKDTAGKNAEVTISPETGLVSVRANAQALRRTTDFIRASVRDAMISVEVEATFVQVSLNDNFEYGLDWTRILQSGKLTVSTLTGGTFAPNSRIAYTGANVSTILNVLGTVGTTEIVSRPRLVTFNHVPATFFDGASEPYLGSVSTTVTGSAGTAQTSGTASFAMEGLNFSIQPDVVDGTHAQIFVMPVQGSITGWRDFDLGSGGKLRVPASATRHSAMRVPIESGKTVIISGLSQDLRSLNQDKAFGLVDTGRNSGKSSKEVIMLLNVTVVPAQEIDPIVAESV